MSNFVPHNMRKVIPRDPSWITKALKTKLKQKNRLHKNYKKHGYKNEDKIRLENFQKECQVDIQLAKDNYLKSIGCKLASDKTLTQKSYWKLIKIS